MRRLAIGRPSWVRRISGSLPRLPTRITLLTEPAMLALLALQAPRCSANRHVAMGARRKPGSTPHEFALTTLNRNLAEHGGTRGGSLPVVHA